MKTTRTPAFAKASAGRQNLLAAAKGWTVVGMKDDWRTIFPPARK